MIWLECYYAATIIAPKPRQLAGGHLLTTLITPSNSQPAKTQAAVYHGFCASSSAKGGRGLTGLCGLAKVGFLVLPEVVHVEVAVGFEPVFVGLDG